MDNIELLKNLFYEVFSVDLSSGVFKELLNSYPHVTIWLEGNIIKITSTKDYNASIMYGINGTKIYESSDYYEIIDLYKITAFGYIYDKEEILTNLIHYLESRKTLALVDNKNANKYNY